GDFWQKLMKKNNYEYIDFYEYGLDDIYLKNAGFNERIIEDENIIPNYYEPFEKQNVDIWGHFQTDTALIFKADGDQDRPNMERR
nr:hypothetical protein [Lachnospiraceae bacterium]